MSHGSWYEHICHMNSNRSLNLQYLCQARIIKEVTNSSVKNIFCLVLGKRTTYRKAEKKTFKERFNNGHKKIPILKSFPDEE